MTDIQKLADLQAENDRLRAVLQHIAAQFTRCGPLTAEYMVGWANEALGIVHKSYRGRVDATTNIDQLDVGT